MAKKSAPCMVLHSIQTLHAECQMESVRTVKLRVLHSFSTFESRSFDGISDVLKKRLGVGLLGSLTTCTLRKLVHVSLGQRMVFVRLSTRRSRSSNTRGSSLGNSPMQLVAWKLPGQLHDAARGVICIFAIRVDIVMQHRRHVVCVFPSAAGKSAICN